MKPLSIQDAIDILPMLDYASNVKVMPNAVLAEELLKHAPFGSKLDYLCEEAAERLSPGVVERMGGLEPEEA